VLHLLYMQFSLKNAEDPEAAKKAVGFPMSLQKTKAVGFPMSLQKKKSHKLRSGASELAFGGLKSGGRLGCSSGGRGGRCGFEVVLGEEQRLDLRLV
jgi:hypothetical protein